MTVQAIESLTYSEPSLYDKSRPDELDKTDFLRLLTTQLQNQDPLDPQDPTEFTAQLTQYSNLEQMMNLNQAVESLQVLQLSSNNTMATSLIGQNLVYAGDSFEIENGEAPELEFYADRAVESVTVNVYNESGTLVRTITGVDASTGLNSVDWNGRQGESETDPLLGNGKYTFSVAGTDLDGNAVSFRTLTSGVATGVIFENGITYLQVGVNRIQLGEIFSVNAPESDTPAAADAQGRNVAATQAKDDSGLSLGKVARALVTTAVKLSPLFL